MDPIKKPIQVSCVLVQVQQKANHTTPFSVDTSHCHPGRPQHPDHWLSCLQIGKERLHEKAAGWKVVGSMRSSIRFQDTSCF
jgi:hypothetical protein